MRHYKRLSILSLGALAAGLLLAGCSSTPQESADDGRIRVVASTDVYGDIASRVAGDLAEVTSIVSGSSQDPHSYEATAQDKLAVSKADIVIENGGGYENFIEPLVEDAGGSELVVLTASDISGYDQEPADGEFNEHMWYDLPTMQKMVEELADALSMADGSNAATFRSNADDLIDSLRELEAAEDEIKAQQDGTGVAITEPVPVYLLEAAGLVNMTPDEFSEAVEEGTDVSPAVLSDTIALFADGDVEMLVYNEQTAGPESERLLEAAEAAGVPVVSVTETLPDGEDYLSWMSGNIDAISRALA